MSVKEILKKLVEINTVKDEENKKIINYIESLLVAKGFKTEMKNNCLIMSIKEKINFGFLGHTDTVDINNAWTLKAFVLQEKDGFLYGLGVCDMKGGIAAILEAVIETNWENKNKGMKLYFTFDEEIDFSGIKLIINSGEKFPENMLIGEPTNNVIQNASKGLLEVNIEFSGISAHSSMPSQGENAIEKSVMFLNELETFYNQLKEDKNNIYAEPCTTMNVAKIQGGSSINIVPDYCMVSIDFRVINNQHIDLILNKLSDLAKKYNAEIEILNNIKAFETENEEKCPTNFITEASFIDSKNRYILGVGPVNPHKANEFITEESLEKLVEQYKNMINKFCD